jgi:hypothetical protein
VICQVAAVKDVCVAICRYNVPMPTGLIGHWIYMPTLLLNFKELRSKYSRQAVALDQITKLEAEASAVSRKFS